MLRNPKYTGYNVWNRHDKRTGRQTIRPRDQWIWSATPVHYAIVPKELFDKVEERAQKNEAASKAPTTRGHAGLPGVAPVGSTYCEAASGAALAADAWRAATSAATTGTAVST
jgi:hypothetical protein